MKTGLIIGLILGVVVIGYLFRGSSADIEAVVATSRSTENTISTREELVVAAEPVRTTVVEKDEFSEDCITIDQYTNSPEVVQDLQRRDSASTSQEEVEAFRAVDSNTVESYANQGDPAAMLVLGYMRVLEAYGEPASSFDKLLNGEQVIQEFWQPQDPLSAEAALALNDGAYWTYEAALNGRLFALEIYGRIKANLFGGAVGLGWIKQDEFEKLTKEQQLLIDPSWVYYQVAYEIAPELKDGLYGAMAYKEPQSEQEAAIRQELVDEFRQAIADARYTMPKFPPAESRSLEQMGAAICDRR